MSKELVSVIIPSFKMGQFIGEALESVGVQTYPHWEVVVVDDAGPEDGTRAAVKAFAARHLNQRVEYIRHETNQGVSVARRTAFEVARGAYIAFLDSDDFFHPKKIEHAVQKLEKSPGCVLIHTAITPISTSLQMKKFMRGWFNQSSFSGAYRPLQENKILTENHICNSTVLCRRWAIQPDDFPKKMVYQYEDWLVWLKLGARGLFYFDPRPLTYYRIHKKSFSSKISQSPASQELARLEMLYFALLSSLGILIGNKVIREMWRGAERYWRTVDADAPRRPVASNLFIQILLRIVRSIQKNKQILCK